MATGPTQSSKDIKKIDLEHQGNSPHASSDQAEDVLALQDIDEALNAKMHIVNNVRDHSFEQISLLLVTVSSPKSFSARMEISHLENKLSKVALINFT